MVFGRNPEKLEAKALQYEQKGKTNKAIKNREKAARIRAKHAQNLPVTGTNLNRPLGTNVSTIPLTTGATSLGFAGTGIPTTGSTISTFPTTTTTVTTQEYDYVPRTPARYEQNALKWEQRGNYSKAQKNREKVWRLQNPQYAQAQAPAFYNNTNSFLGYNVPYTGTRLTGTGLTGTGLAGTGLTGTGLTGTGLTGTGLTGAGYGQPITTTTQTTITPISSGGFQRRSFFGNNNRDPLYYENRAAEYQRLGNQKKALRYQQKAGLLRGNNGAYTSKRTFADYERNALKWEQRGNWQKAQKNREKAWRLKNPTYLNPSWTAPNFYQQQRFSGYDIPFQSAQTNFTTPNNYSYFTQSNYSSYLPQQTGFQQQTSSFPQTGFQQQTSTFPQQTGFQQQTSSFPQTGLQQQTSTFPQQTGFQRQSFFGANNRDPLYYQNRAAEYQRLGNQKKALRYQQKAALLTGNNGAYTSRRTQADYETRALKWEQRGNWQKAQKNREKAWRIMNPTYMNPTWTAPNFYQQQRFTGYNIPFQSSQTNFTTPNNYSYFTQSNSSFFNQGVNSSFFNKTAIVGGAPIVHTITAPTTVETHLHNTIVQQTTRMEKIVEVQPIIHREIDAPEVRVIEKHVYESVPRSGPDTITRATIVEETIKPRIIEEIQPVVHREVPQTFIEQVEQHVTEHVVLPTTQSKQVIDTQMGFSNMSLGQSRFAIAYPGISSFHRYSQFGQPTRNVALYQQRLAEYERLGNQKKALRYREKIAKIQGLNGGQYKSLRTPADYERRALKWEQRGNWQKAQRNREKAWRLQNPQYTAFNTHPAPLFYDNGHKFLGYNQQIPSNIQQQSNLQQQIPSNIQQQSNFPQQSNLPGQVLQQASSHPLQNPLQQQQQANVQAGVNLGGAPNLAGQTRQNLI